jgi:hypothetical protein
MFGGRRSGGVEEFVVVCRVGGLGGAISGGVMPRSALRGVLCCALVWTRVNI